MWTIFAMRSNLILILIALEMVLLSINILLVFFSIYLDDLLGQVFALFVLTVAAAESAIGLAILVAYYRLRSNISVELLATAKG
jgi:NADH-quinone oxidoreductase subunit K